MVRISVMKELHIELIAFFFFFVILNIKMHAIILLVSNFVVNTMFGMWPATIPFLTITINFKAEFTD